MKKFNIKAIALALTIILVGSACENNFEEINVDPQRPTQTSESFLFTGVLAALNMTGNQWLYLNNHRAYQWSQLAASGFQDPNEIHDLGRDELWNNYYNSLRNVRELERRIQEDFDPERKVNRLAMLRIAAGYFALRATDLYGDMPYSQAGRGLTGDGSDADLRPAYDSQESIYKSVLADLEWAVDNMVTNLPAETPAGNDYLGFGANDVVYGSDVTKWVKFANALRLRYALRMSDVDQAAATAIISDVLSGTPVLPEGDEDMFAFGQDINLTTGMRYWAFQFYEGIRLGENAWNHMTDDPNPDGSGIIDPRVYVWYETNEDDEWVPMPQDPFVRDDLTGHPGNDQRRGDPTGFDFRGNYSGFNWFLIEDDEHGPQFHLTFSEVCFLRAEAYQRGFATGDAQEWYERGIRSSIERWYDHGTRNIDYVNPPATPDAATIDAFIAHPQIAYNAADGLRLIHVQRWLDLMLNPQEAWHLAKRSDLIPELTVREGDSGEARQTPTRIFYPLNEADNNEANFNAQLAKMPEGNTLTAGTWVTGN
ncbi:SusD/RagB family nutrient-binding outer membrane lipoprotein [Fulvivirgaceae bacterium BMA10]|uniref:SusD/RagB family nutrient-binding outer membrane lipoprotein n=1 Tax=Splendidivirga corallicola TaxID=3051826 RepID=A0ABT8KKP7_9BACT|nr:SusD/RagB family nutrient-binding outer membrane lipoprotein [Fulvivirgaceae bacterium BMA10]